MDEQTPEQQQPEVNPIEEQAREQGWVPKDEFNGEEHKWVDAGEFLRRGELFGKIESQNKELKDIRRTLAEFKNHTAKVQEQAYKKALADLKAKKREARMEGDVDLELEVEEQIEEVKQAQTQIQETRNEPVEQQLHPEFVAFTERNGWYNNNKPMRAWADMRGSELAQRGLPPSEVLRTVEKEIREEFPNKFNNPNRNKANSVESSRGSASASNGSRYTPNAIEERLATKFVNEGLYKNKQEYFAELEAMNKN